MRHPKRKAGNIQHGTYAPPSPEQNIRRYQEVGSVTVENIVLTCSSYGGRGYSMEADFINRNSLNVINNTIKLNQENPFHGWIPISKENTGAIVSQPRTPPPFFPALEEIAIPPEDSQYWLNTFATINTTINQLVNYNQLSNYLQ